MSKNRRATIFSVYLRPWTLGERAASKTVPYIADLDKVSEPAGENATLWERNIRAAWKEYMQKALPHAKRQIQNFMLA